MALDRNYKENRREEERLRGKKERNVIAITYHNDK